jgi:hypothetical protein
VIDCSPPKMPRDALGWGFSSLEDQQSYQRFRRRQTHKEWELEGLVKMGRTPQYEQRVKRRRKEFQRKEEEIATYQQLMASGWRPWHHLTTKRAKELGIYDTLVEAFGGAEECEELQRHNM